MNLLGVQGAGLVVDDKVKVRPRQQAGDACSGTSSGGYGEESAIGGGVCSRDGIGWCTPGEVQMDGLLSIGRALQIAHAPLGRLEPLDSMALSGCAPSICAGHAML